MVLMYVVVVYIVAITPMVKDMKLVVSELCDGNTDFVFGSAPGNLLYLNEVVIDDGVGEDHPLRVLVGKAIKDKGDADVNFLFDITAKYSCIYLAGGHGTSAAPLSACAQAGDGRLTASPPLPRCSCGLPGVPGADQGH